MNICPQPELAARNTKILAASTNYPRKMNAEVPTPLLPLHILVAEDSPVNQRLAIGLLQRQGYAVTVVNNGMEAISAIQAGGFDAILMDIDMPGIDGLLATRLIRAAEGIAGDGTLRRVPIVAVTTRDNAAECLRAGMDAHVRKPLSPRTLRRILANLVNRSAA